MGGIDALFPEVSDDGAKVTMFAKKLEGRFGPDAFYRFEIIASKQYTEFNELGQVLC